MISSFRLLSPSKWIINHRPQTHRAAEMLGFGSVSEHKSRIQHLGGAMCLRPVVYYPLRGAQQTE
jgi:hypothetical protein